jgi:hypothetical protein
MTHDSGPMTCGGFADQLASYLDDGLSGLERLEVESHAAACAACGGLIADLDVIRRDAALLPALEPSRDLWAGIAARIDAPVLPLEVARQARPGTTRHAWIRPSVAAAALIFVTAGVTHLLTRASYAPVASTPVAVPSADSQRRLAERSGSDAGSTGTQRSSSADEPAAARRPAGRNAATARLVSAVPTMTDAQPTYDREIGKLRAIVAERRSQLDPRTIAVLDQSIAVIDSAIAQSRAALASDPASGFLATQLNHSLDKKVELLRTAALLPSRT